MGAPAMTIDVLAEGGVLVKLGGEPVYFSGECGDVGLERPEHLHVQGRHLLGCGRYRAALPRCIASLKRFANTRYRFKRLGHAVAEGPLKRSLLALVGLALLVAFGHWLEPTRKEAA